MDSRYRSQSVRRSFLLCLTLSTALVVGACQRQSQALKDPAPDVMAELTVIPDPPRVGQSALHLSLTDESGAPIEGAAVSVRGDMGHAGMVPVFGDGKEIEPGLYQVPFEWTMAGDWIVELSVQLADERELVRTFDLRVPSEDS